MRNLTLVFSGAMACLAVSTGAGATPDVAASGAAQKTPDPIYMNGQYSFMERAADLVSRMTLAEEVNQLRTNSAPAIPRLGVHAYTYWSEGQHGVNRINDSNGPLDNVHSTSFPTNFASTMTWDPPLIYKESSAIAAEARGFLDKSLWGTQQNNLGASPQNYGFLTYWAPTINLDRDPRWGRNDEAFGEDPHLASMMAGAFVNGLQGQTFSGVSKTGYLEVAATAKHFIGYDVEDGRTGISSKISDADLRDYYTPVFRHLIEKAHVAGLMTSYNAVNGTPAVANTYTVNELAQRTFGFKGYITSDCGAVGTTYETFPKTAELAANGHGGHDWAPPGWATDHAGTEATWTDTRTGATVSGAAAGEAYALRAGTALDCMGDEATVANITHAIKAGVLSKGVIDRDLTRVFAVRMATGEFDPPGKVPYTHIDKSAIQSPAHQALAETVAENALVLLKNDTVPGSNKRLLPMDAAKVKQVVILGDMAGKVTLGGYSSDPATQITAVQGITYAVKMANPDAAVVFDAADTSSTAHHPAKLSAKIKANIESADLVVVFVGTNEAVAREGHDRANLEMPGNYGSLIRQVAALGNHRMVLVIQSDGPVKINDVMNDFPSIVFSGYNGETQGEALARVLTGAKNPSGHLDFTWYRDDSQLPEKSNYGLTPKSTDGLGRTYMYFTGKPTYPFGFGLSYSRFTYSDLSVSPGHASPDSTVQVHFTVTNTGGTPGATVAQLYVASPRTPGKQMPLEQLEGFQRTAELAPGASQQITLPVKVSHLAFWNEDKLKSVVHNGAYKFQVGSDSRDIAASKIVEVEGTWTPKIAHVTVQPENLIYHVGDTLDLSGTNRWIKSDTNPSLEPPHAVADHIVEAVYNNGAFADLKHLEVHYRSSDVNVASVNARGLVKATGQGSAIITATVDGASGTTVIVVK